MRDHYSLKAKVLLWSIAVIAALWWPQITAAQVLTEFPVSVPPFSLESITKGPDNALWFTGVSQ